MAGFDPSAGNRVAAAARAAYAANPQADLPASDFSAIGGLIFASADRPQAYNTPRNQFSPRIGVAYTPERLGRSMVLRGGFGVYYHTYGITGINRPGFAQTTQLVATNDGFLRPYATLSNPFPDGILQPGTPGVDQNLGQGVLQLRAEAFNALDHVQFSGPQLNSTNANFGKVTAQTNAPRSFQFAARFKF